MSCARSRRASRRRAISRPWSSGGGARRKLAAKRNKVRKNTKRDQRDPRSRSATRAPEKAEGYRAGGARGWFNHHRVDLALAGLLALSVTVLFWRTRGYGLVIYDDHQYLFGNQVVDQGLTIHGLRWALTTIYHWHWHPLTWLSHMLDVELFADSLGGHHLSNVALHTANTLLLFLALRVMTGAPLRSALVAALFALHPLHVEPVAWIVGRKDLLSTSFALLTMLAYHHYARHPNSRRFSLVVLFLVLALMSKIYVIIIPLLLLGLDVWPLRRVSLPGGADAGQAPVESSAAGLPAVTWRRALAEKAILLAPVFLALAFEIWANLVGSKWGLHRLSTDFELLAIATFGYLRYLGQTVWPVGLITPYPPQEVPALWQTGLAVLFLVGVSAAAWWQRRSRPALLVGWWWYLLALLPMSGVLHVGTHRWSDSYTYFSLVGVFIAIAWALPTGRGPVFERAASAVAGLALLACFLMSWPQVAIWRDGPTQVMHALKHSQDNASALSDHGVILAERGETEQALEKLTRAAVLAPDDARVLYNRGLFLTRLGRPEEGSEDLHRSLDLDPDNVDARHGFGLALVGLGDLAAAAAQYREALRREPIHVPLIIDLASVLARQGDLEGAEERLRDVLRFVPDSVPAHGNLAHISLKQGRLLEAEQHYRSVLRLRPGDAEAYRGLAEISVQRDELPAAIAQLRRAIEATPGRLPLYVRKSELHLRLGQVAEATGELQAALAQDPDFAPARAALDRLRTPDHEATVAPVEGGR